MYVGDRHAEAGNDSFVRVGYRTRNEPWTQRLDDRTEGFGWASRTLFAGDVVTGFRTCVVDRTTLRPTCLPFTRA